MKKCHTIGLILFIFFNIQSVCAMTTMNTDEYYMQRAITIAKNNPDAPFAAVIVDNQTGKILAEGLNNSSMNPTFHGEIVAINNFMAKHPEFDRSKLSLYTTAEPCPMCQSAIIWAKIPRVVFATSIDYLMSQGWNQITIRASEINNNSPFYKGTLKGGVLAEKTNILFQQKKQ